MTTINSTTTKTDAEKTWKTICLTGDLVANSGVCALLNKDESSTLSDEQVAIFHLPDTEQEVYALGNYDPIGQANVLYRGIVGSVGDDIVVASPLYKQHFSLRTGKCLQEDTQVQAYQARIVDEQVQLFV